MSKPENDEKVRQSYQTMYFFSLDLMVEIHEGLGYAWEQELVGLQGMDRAKRVMVFDDGEGTTEEMMGGRQSLDKKPNKLSVFNP